MTEPILLTSDSPLLEKLQFKPYRYITIRRVRPFMPLPEEPQTMELKTPWGAILTVKSGDMLLSEIDTPNEMWPVDSKIFDATYLITEPGFCIKSAVTLLVHMIDITDGNADGLVTVETLEGPQTVRAGDFFLARGVQGEIWSLPNEKVNNVMKPVE